MKKNLFFKNIFLLNILFCSFLYSNMLPSRYLLENNNIIFKNSSDKFDLASNITVKSINKEEFNDYKNRFQLIEINKIIDSESKLELTNVELFFDVCVFNNKNNKVFVSNINNTKLISHKDHYSGIMQYDKDKKILSLDRKIIQYNVDIRPNLGKLVKSPEDLNASTLKEMCDKIKLSDCTLTSLYKIVNLNDDIKRPDDIHPDNEILFLNDYSQQISDLGWLNANLKGYIIDSDDSSKKNISLKWNNKTKSHTFEVWSKIKFKFSIDDPRFISKVYNKEIGAKKTDFTYNLLTFSPYILKEKINYYTSSEKEIDNIFYNQYGFTLKKENFEDIDLFTGVIDENFIVSNLESYISRYKEENQRTISDIIKSIADAEDENNKQEISKIKNDIKESNKRSKEGLVRLPFVVDSISKKRVPFEFKASIVLFDGKFLYIDSDAEILAEKYMKKKIGLLNLSKDKSNIVYLDRKKERYNLSLNLNDELKSLYTNDKHLFYSNNDIQLNGYIYFEDSKRTEEVGLKYDDDKKVYHFDFEIKDPFSLTIDDYRFEELTFTYNKDLSKQKNRDKNKILTLKNFKLILNIEEEYINKIKSFYIFSDSNKNDKIQSQIKNNQLHFNNLKWTDSPYSYKYNDELIYIDLEPVTMNQYFSRLENLNSGPVIETPLNIYDKISLFGIFIKYKNGNPANNKNIELIENDIFKNLHTNERIGISNEDGVIAFKNVFSIKKVKIKVEDIEYSYSDLERVKSMGDSKKKFYTLNLKK